MSVRTRNMMEVAVAHAQAAFASSCGHEPLTRCGVYEGLVWNGGTHLTVVVDRATCRQHATGPALVDEEFWIYDIQGESVIYLGKHTAPFLALLLNQPGDEDTTPTNQGAPS